MKHKNGAGLKVLSTERWYGPGYCCICGGSPVPQAVRYWDPDDGWKLGVLCEGCGAEACERGPREGDFACAESVSVPRKDAIDTLAQLGDMDNAYTEAEDLS